jgi:hypothetical protein
MYEWIECRRQLGVDVLTRARVGLDLHDQRETLNDIIRALSV